MWRGAALFPLCMLLITGWIGGCENGQVATPSSRSHFTRPERNGLAMAMRLRGGIDGEAGAGAGVSETNRQLWMAAEAGDDGSIRNLARKGAACSATSKEEGWTALHFAASRGRANVIPSLVRMGADVNAVDNKGHTPMSLAAADGHIQFIERLSSLGANPNIGSQVGNLALHRAASSGATKTCKLLIKIGTDPNATNVSTPRAN